MTLNKVIPFLLFYTYLFFDTVHLFFDTSCVFLVCYG